MQTKICSKCKVEKTLNEFSTRKEVKDGVRSACRLCTSKIYQAYSRTKKGLTKEIYSGQRNSSRIRKHPLPDYTLNELREWCFSQPLFNDLYNDWVKSDYNRWLRPSCDRTDDYQGYSLDRLQLMTWDKNKQKYHKIEKPVIF
jgi:hypothetical protein